MSAADPHVVGRGRGAQPRRLGTLATAGLFTARAIICSRVSVTLVVGLFSNDV
jgi:hypothetical protein